MPCSPTLPNHYPEFIHWTWPQFEPYYQNLIERSLSADNVAAWLADWSHLGKIVHELKRAWHWPLRSTPPMPRPSSAISRF